MKKLLAILGISVLCLPLTACFGSTDDGSGKTEKPGGTKEPVTPVTPVVPITPEIPSDPVQPGEVAVTFDAGDGAFGSGQDSVVLKPDKDGKVVFDRLPWRDGYAFTGWYNGTVKYNPDQSYGTSQTFTAKYEYGGEDVVYTALFNENSAVSIAINMSDAEWKKLDADLERCDEYGNKISKSPIYRQAGNVVIGINSGDGMLNYYYEDVGVRLKGNTSRHHFYGNDGFYAATHLKLSFKETFDDKEEYEEFERTDWTDRDDDRAFRKARTFGGMTKIDIKYNSTYDETYIRELYAMKLFRENGIYAPHVTLGSVTALNKDTDLFNLGVYRIHEPVDEEFVLRHIEDGNKAGDLYKCTWGNRGGNGADLTDDNLEYRVGVNDELKNELYAYDKKTNKKKGFDSIKNFISAIGSNNASDLGNYIDVDHFAKFEAINYILGNPDCIRNHANNYYLYFRKSDNKAIIIPYDYDRCLGSREWDNFVGMSDSALGPYTRQTTLYDTGGLRNPLYIKLLVKGAPTNEGSALMKYRANLLTMSESNMLKADTFNALMNKYQTRYGSLTSNAIGGDLGNNLAWGTLVTFRNNQQNMSYADYISAKLDVLRNNIDNYRN